MSEDLYICDECGENHGCYHCEKLLTVAEADNYCPVHKEMICNDCLKRHHSDCFFDVRITKDERGFKIAQCDCGAKHKLQLMQCTWTCQDCHREHSMVFKVIEVVKNA